MDEKPSINLNEKVGSSEHGNNKEIKQQSVKDSLKTEDSSTNKTHYESLIENFDESKEKQNWIKIEQEESVQVVNKESCDNDKELSITSYLGENKGNRQCDPCLFDDVKENANSFCVVCVEYLCKACARDHRRSKATRKHKVLIDTEMPDDPKIFEMMKLLVSCPDHPQMEISFKCKTHEKFICTKCLVVSHRKCEDVTEILNQTTNDESSVSTDAITLLPDKLQSVYEMTVSVRSAKEENIKQLHFDTSCILTERSDYIKSLQEKLLKLDEISKSETETIMTKTLSKLEEDVDRCKKIELEEVNQKCLLDAVLNYGNTTEINIICEKVENDVKRFKDDTTNQVKPMVRLKFERNPSFESIESVGSVSVINGKNEKDDQDKPSKKGTVIELSSEEVGEETLNVKKHLHCKPLIQSSVSKRRCMYDIRSTFNKTSCSVSSILLLSDGIVVLTDYSNRSIKVLNSDYSLRTGIGVYGKPIDMCQFSEQNLAVIVDGVKCIKKYRILEGTMYTDGVFPCKLYPISIGSIPDNNDQAIILFSDEEMKTPKKSDYDQIEVQIRNMKHGQILRTFSSFENKSSLKMVLENPRRIRMNLKSQNTFLISENMKLHCIEPDPLNNNIVKEKWYYKSYKEKVISEITDIAVDKEGNIYVCGRDSKNIHQISGMRYMTNRVLITVTGTPLSLCIDDGNRRLIVGCEEDDFIYIIQLE